MENSYGIGVANRYALFLDDESDPLEALKMKEQEKELRKKTKVAEKENKGKVEAPIKGKAAPIAKKPVIKETPNHKVADNKREDVKPNNQRSNDNKPERPYNKFNNENREERNNRRNREDKPFNGPYENRDREERPRRGGPNEGEFESRRRGGGGGPKSVGGPDGRGGRGDRPERTDRGERGERGERGDRGDRGERGDTRPPRRNFDGERRGKREFDRQSGSDKTHGGYRGVKPIDKREGGGAHNWGSNKDVIEEADKNSTSATAAADAADMSWNEENKADTSTTTDKNGSSPGEATKAPTEPATGEGGDSTAAPPAADVVEEPKELTLDEWKAQRAGRLKPTYNLRKAGEGEDPTQWKKMYELNKKKDGEEEDSDEDEYDAAEYPQRVGRQKHVLDIDIQFNDARRSGPTGGGGRGGGGGGDGSRGGGRGGPRGERRERTERGEGAERGGGGGGGDKGGEPRPRTERGERGGRGGRDRGERRGGGGGGGGGGPAGGGDAGENRDGGERRNERRFNRNNVADGADHHQGDEKMDTRNAPKVDDERDFPSLG